MSQKSQEEWVHTKCAACYAGCIMKVKVVDGVMVKAEGVEDSDFGPRGGLCGKGTATILDFYDPNRCSIGYHPLHSYLATAVYLGLSAIPKTRLVGLGLVIHMVLDWLDCLWMSVE